MTRHMTDRSAGVKARIRNAAVDLFSSRGYAATSVRDIASAADVDPSIVIRHFGSKEALFIETVRLRARDADILSGPLEEVGERLVRRILERPEDFVRSRGAFAALLRASDSDDVRDLLLQELTTNIVDPLEARLPVTNAKLRAHLFCAQLIGLFTALWVIEDAELVDAEVGALAGSYGSLLQSTLTGDIFSRAERM